MQAVARCGGAHAQRQVPHRNQQLELRRLGSGPLLSLRPAAARLAGALRAALHPTGNWKLGAAANGEAEPLVRTRHRRAGPTGDRTYRQAHDKGDASTSGLGASKEFFRILREGGVGLERTGPSTGSGRRLSRAVRRTTRAAARRPRHRAGWWRAKAGRCGGEAEMVEDMCKIPGSPGSAAHLMRSRTVEQEGASLNHSRQGSPAEQHVDHREASARSPVPRRIEARDL